MGKKDHGIVNKILATGGRAGTGERGPATFPGRRMG
jgi:hypothetical protein